MTAEELLHAFNRSTILISAHPDDETISAGGILQRLQQPVLIEMTNGSPRDSSYARAAGFLSASDYADVRRAELYHAMDFIPIDRAHIHLLDFLDQELVLNLESSIHKLLNLFQAYEPDVILTHAYEGGHPDHDATAFCVHVASKLLSEARGKGPALIEFPSYHSEDGSLVLSRFLPFGDHSETIYVLSEHEVQAKLAIRECYKSQQHIIRRFPIKQERFRPAPAYDFMQPPHLGVLLYETLQLGISCEQFMKHTAALSQSSLLKTALISAHE